MVEEIPRKPLQSANPIYLPYITNLTKCLKKYANVPHDILYAVLCCALLCLAVL